MRLPARLPWLLLLLLLVPSFVLAGTFRVLGKRTKSLNLGIHSVVLFSVRGTNTYKPKKIPYFDSYYFTYKVDGGHRVRAFDRHRLSLITSKGGESEFLYSAALPAGSYQLKTLFGYTRAKMRLPLYDPHEEYGTFELPPGSVAYLGHFEVVLRERAGETEWPAGSRMPWPQQKLYGIPDSTFDVEVVDAYETDIPRFVEAYPVLQGQEVLNLTLPPWVRPTTEQVEGWNEGIVID